MYRVRVWGGVRSGIFFSRVLGCRGDKVERNECFLFVSLGAVGGVFIFSFSRVVFSFVFEFSGLGFRFGVRCFACNFIYSFFYLYV